jgi:hypothetical protein
MLEILASCDVEIERLQLVCFIDPPPHSRLVDFLVTFGERDVDVLKHDSLLSLAAGQQMSCRFVSVMLYK